MLERDALLLEQSVRDYLTGLFNRRYMEETLERELLRAARKQLSLSIVMLDVDDFKRFNDTGGHAAGDAVLRELGSLLLVHFRGEDISCRYGGDEFIIVLPDASKEVTRHRAELLSRNIPHFPFQCEGKALDTLTLSFGVASFPEDGSTGTELLLAADAALYRAKRARRSCMACGGL